MDDIVELVLQAWLWLLVLLPIGPVRGPRDARPDTPREKRMQYIVRPLVWMTLAGGAATGCAIGVGWVRLVCAPALGLFITSLSWLAMRWLLWLWHGGAEQAAPGKEKGSSPAEPRWPWYAALAALVAALIAFAVGWVLRNAAVIALSAAALIGVGLGLSLLEAWAEEEG